MYAGLLYILYCIYILYIYLWLFYIYDIYIYIYIYLLWSIIYIYTVMIDYDIRYTWLHDIWMIVYQLMYNYMWIYIYGYMDLIEHEAFYRVKSPCLSGCRKGRRGEWPGVCRPEGLRGETLGKHWVRGAHPQRRGFWDLILGIPSGNVTVCYGKSP